MLKSKIALLLAAAALALTACDNGPSAVAQKQAAGTQMADNVGEAATDANARTPDGPREDHRNDPVAKVNGKPMWSASRRYSADENAQRAFARNGQAFGADNLDEFVEKAHAFVQSPPRGTLTPRPSAAGMHSVGPTPPTPVRSQGPRRSKTCRAPRGASTLGW